MKLLIKLLLLTSFLAGCTPARNVHEAKLMPESVAKSILAKYSSNAWVNNPIGHEPHTFLCNGDSSQPLPFSSISRVMLPSILDHIKDNELLLKSNKFSCPIEIKLQSQTPFTKDEINDVLDALISLGAKLSPLQY